MTKTVCPKCGEINSISRYRDVRYWRSVVGVGADEVIVIDIDREYPDAQEDGYWCGACDDEQYHDSIVRATLTGTPFA